MGLSNVVVVGGASGIGREVCSQVVLAGGGVHVIDLQRVDDLALRSSEIADVTSKPALVAAYEAIFALSGKIDGVVNCAGITRVAPAATYPAEDWQAVLATNLSGTFFSCQAAFPFLAPGASIVNIASIVATRAGAGRAAYSASKAGVVAMSRVLATEWAETPGIRVNCVSPAWVDTPMIRKTTQDLDPFLRRTPMKRIAAPADIAEPVLFLLGDGARYVTGIDMSVDGGWTYSA